MMIIFQSQKEMAGRIVGQRRFTYKKNIEFGATIIGDDEAHQSTAVVVD